MGLYDCICIYVFAWSNHLFKSMNLKNFSAMKTWQKVALGTLGLVVANNLLQERSSVRSVVFVSEIKTYGIHRITEVYRQRINNMV